MKRNALTWLLAAVGLLMLASGCNAYGTTTTTTPPVTHTVPELEYRLIAEYPTIFWCDPDVYPISRPGQEEANAQEQFPAISANTTTFDAILAHLGLAPAATYTDADKLQVYREYKLLTHAVQITPAGNIYDFSLRIGEGEGEKIDGTITPSGSIAVTSREPSFNTCPICLAEGTLIATPAGPVAVEQLREGMAVWTADTQGNRVAAVVAATARTEVPATFQIVTVVLGDGRTVTASPGHPTADGWAIGDLQPGDVLDGATVVSATSATYGHAATYDILPSGPTGTYWANGILLGSTLAR
jgi:hypothetical protein